MEIGQRVGRFRIEGHLGQGGVGKIYAAYDERLRRPVALKVLRRKFRSSAEVRSRFLREARALSQLDHPNVCRIYEHFEEAGTEYLVLELIEGKDLYEAKAPAAPRSSKLRMAVQVTEALVAAHARGIIHRDLKPTNIMVTTSGSVKVLDFGLACSVDATDLAETDLVELAEKTTCSSLTETPWVPDPMATTTLMTAGGEILGTPAFMSPEQAQGRRLTPASDIYALGLLLQWLFTGRPAYPPKGTQELLQAAARAKTLSAHGLERDLARLLSRLKRLEPQERPTAVETLAMLRQISAKGHGRRHRWHFVAAALTCVALVARGRLGRKSTLLRLDVSGATSKGW